MEVYLVGGAVRDLVMKKTPSDLDYVVVGSSPQEMIDLGYKQVGKSFPVFLHPVTGDEYALARTERSTGDGHNDFDVEWEGVTLEEDLERRDLTINSMAIDTVILKDSITENFDVKYVIDPFNGLEDIENRVLRATSGAFAEDPLRVVRVARFLSRFGPEWSVEHQTYNTMKLVGQDLGLYTLPGERIGKEIQLAMSNRYPSLFFEVLKDIFGIFNETSRMENTMQRLDHHPEGDVWTHTKMVMDLAAEHYMDPKFVFACYCHDFGKNRCMLKYGNAYGHELEGLSLINDFCDLYKMPNSYRKAALDMCAIHTKVHGVLGRGGQKISKAKTIMKIIEHLGGLKDPSYFYDILRCCKMDARGRGKTYREITAFRIKEYPQLEFMVECLVKASGTNTDDIVQKLIQNGKSGPIIGEEIRAARINSIKQVVNKWKQKS